MEHDASLISQLKIDRSAAPVASSHRGKLKWGIAGIAVAAALGVAGYSLSTSRSAVIPIRTVVAVRSVPGEAIASSPILEASGYVVALRQATVSAKSIFKVKEVLVQEGQPVKEGEVIARMDDTTANASWQEAKARVAQTRAEANAARVAADDDRPIFERDRRQLAEGLISQGAFDAAKQTYDAAEASAEVAEENTAVAEKSQVVAQSYLDDTLIRAPFDGMVTLKNAQPGEIVSPQFVGGGGIAKIVDMDSLEVDVDVGESLINRVHPHQDAEVSLEAYPDVKLPAEVIAVIPTADRAKATVKVRVGFKTKDPRIVPEMGAKVAFLDAPRAAPSSVTAPVVMVPAEAVEVKGNNGSVFVVSGDIVKQREVTLGALTKNTLTILTGVEQGNVLAMGDLRRLRDGMKIQVTP